MRLWQNPGWGSAIVEAQLAAYGMAVELVEAGDVYSDPSLRQALAAVNPVAQVPALQLDSGEVMTETAAITLHLADLARSDLLVPGPDAPERAAFLRGLVYIVANIYPCHSFGDVPERFVPADAVEAYRTRVNEHHKHLWQVFGGEAARRGGPWVLGARYSALDIFVGVMVHWRPRRDWFRANEPGLAAIADAVAARPELKAVFARNFG